MWRSMTWSTSRSATRRDLFRGWPFTWFFAAETSSDPSRRAEKSVKGIKLKTSFFFKELRDEEKKLFEKRYISRSIDLLMLEIQEDVRENIENMKTFLQRRIVHLTKRSDWDAREKSHSTKCLADIRRKRNERRNFEGMIDARRTKRWRQGRVGRRRRKILRPRSARFFCSSSTREGTSEETIEKYKVSRCTFQIEDTEIRRWKCLSDAWDYESHRTKIETRSLWDLIKRKKSNLRSASLNQVSDIETSCERRRW